MALLATEMLEHGKAATYCLRTMPALQAGLPIVQAATHLLPQRPATVDADGQGGLAQQ